MKETKTLDELAAKFLRRLVEPAKFFNSVEGPVERGNIVEIRAPDGEILLFAVIDIIKAEGERTFDFVWGVLLTDFIEPTPDMPVVYGSTNSALFTAHCWLEGPVLADAIVRSVDRLGPDSLAAVDAALRTTAIMPPKHAALRQSLYKQVKPVYEAPWEKLLTF